jgi:prepilin-type N-terminal cleavage/methylation domain-containing protein
MTRRQPIAAEHGLTLVELLVVLMVMAILLAVTMASYIGYKNKADRVTAQANVHVILPSLEGYRADNETYVGMTLLGLKLNYDQSIDPSMYTLTSLTDTDYCVSAKSGSQAWKKTGPDADVVPGECP